MFDTWLAIDGVLVNTALARFTATTALVFTTLTCSSAATLVDYLPGTS